MRSLTMFLFRVDVTLCRLPIFLPCSIHRPRTWANRPGMGWESVTGRARSGPAAGLELEGAEPLDTT
jgi:hypothetical protein